MDAEAAMKFALQLARAATGQTSPNPVVGAVIIKDDQLVGFGAHLQAGEGHAEVKALEMAGEKAAGATIYITLEPCNHKGKTPACTELLIEKGINRAVIACSDPNGKVSGQGIERLRESGMDVEVGLFEKKAIALNAAFFHYIKTNLPYVTMKSAVSLDGKTATVTGDSQWITGEEARLDVHHYRNKNDAILVGVNTVINDNPRLTTRLPEGGKNPIRIIVDNSLRTPAHSHLINDGESATWIFVGDQVQQAEIDQFPKDPSVEIIQLPGKIKIEHVLAELGRREIMSLYVEGGAEVNGSFLESKLLNQLITYVAPKLIGGKTAPTSFSGTGSLTIADALSLEIKAITQIGTDLKIVAEPIKEDK
ncbi:MAG TPA: bifunctional diaminohydroxyphosphoribosylaminopyrimidine deaminase/5-amino-6-(5-phosphoribosylamino)uracil reductase RibD [Virgibacillus sp.]|nr:bifunctional diaminohydroxyphosphoribosylaminopyrimidine deaminase/5-amino-6-(5-phosphoribosylamino)uracil reductase RibD [Virgibacillus sp.]